MAREVPSLFVQVEVVRVHLDRIALPSVQDSNQSLDPTHVALGSTTPEVSESASQNNRIPGLHQQISHRAAVQLLATLGLPRALPSLLAVLGEGILGLSNNPKLSHWGTIG